MQKTAASFAWREPRSPATSSGSLRAELASLSLWGRTCVLALVRHVGDPEPIIAQGDWHGTIVDAPRGTGGFGYDPHFLDPETGLTGAELPLETKNELSHRGKAMRALLAQLGQERGPR